MAGEQADDRRVDDDTAGTNYTVVARRYRPRTLEELVGQEHVATALRGAIQSGRVGHAYLFTGARGVGKTSAARILAKCLNSPGGPTVDPDLDSDICRSIADGKDIDVLEIDGASNRGIDEIRQLRANVGVRPSRSTYKIYIIDEVHMLSRDAFNALLKTLEEPPEHVKFIFCTTEPNKIPVTILSRCQRFDFGGIATNSIAQRLSQIVQSEGMKADDEALQLVARRATGSMRDAQSALEQILAFGSDHITAESVHRMLGTADDRQLHGMVQHLVERNAAGALADLDSMIQIGSDPIQILEQLLGVLRDLMAAAVGCPDDAMMHVPHGQSEQLRESAAQLGLPTILAMIQIVQSSLMQAKQNTFSRIVAEMTLVRLCELEDLKQISALIESLTEAGAADPSSRPAARQRADAGQTSRVPREADRPRDTSSAQADPAPAVPPTSAPPDTASDATAEPSAVATQPETPLPAAQPSVDDPAPTAVADPLPLAPESAHEVWLKAIKRLGGMTAENARKFDRVAISAPNRLAVTFKAAYTFNKDYCQRPEHAALLEGAIREVTGCEVKLQFDVVADDPVSDRSQPLTQSQLIARTSQLPMVAEARELFDAQVTRVATGESKQESKKT